jgi:hypothetical protein
MTIRGRDYSRECLVEGNLVIVLSLNARWVGDNKKKLAFEILFSIFNPKVIMIQETLCE